jgi:hypothetical protein
MSQKYDRSRLLAGISPFLKALCLAANLLQRTFEACRMSQTGYKQFNISVHAKQNADGLWVPDIRIFSAVGKVQTLDDGAFETRGEAEEGGMRLAKAWIDRQSSHAHNC